MYKFSKFKAKRTLQKVKFEHKAKLNIHQENPIQSSLIQSEPIYPVPYFVRSILLICSFVRNFSFIFFKETNKIQIIWAVVYLF